MKNKLTLTQIRVILITAAILLIVLTFFLVYQRNIEQANNYDNQAATAEKEIQRLQALESDNQTLEVMTSLYTSDMEDYADSFPVKLTQQKSVYLLHRLETSTGVKIQSINVGASVPFFYGGQVLKSEGDQKQAEEENKQNPISEITKADSLKQMVGSMAKYDITVTGTTKQIYDALDWIRDSEEKLSVGDVNIQFDQSTGELAGTIGVNFYCMLGNGQPYSEPDTSEFSQGVKNIFGAMK